MTLIQMVVPHICMTQDFQRIKSAYTKHRFLAQSCVAITIIEVFGNDSTALNSVPTAIFCFLSHPLSFEEAVVYAVGLGGDTDTIAAMTGALSGAFHGKQAFPSHWTANLENVGKGRDYIENLARTLWRVRKGEL